MSQINIFAVVVSLLCSVMNLAMLCLILWQGGKHRPINMFMLAYLANGFVWGLAAAFIRSSSLFGYDPTGVFYLNASTLTGGAYTLFGFVIVYLGLWDDPNRRWFRWLAAGGLGVTVVTSVLLFQGLLAGDVSVTPAGILTYTITPLGYMMFALVYCSHLGTNLLLVLYKNQFWRDLVFWGVFAAGLGGFSTLFQEIAGVYSVPILSTTISVMLFTNFILRENVFSPQVELNQKLEQTIADLERSEAYAQSLMENTPDIILSVTADYKLKVINTAAHTFLQRFYGSVPPIGELLTLHMKPFHQQEWHSAFGRAFQGERFTFEKRYQLPDGSQECFIEFMFNPVTNQNGTITTISVFARDITERKRAERVNYLQALTFDHVSESLLLLDIDNLVTDCNQATLDILGYTKEEIAQAYLSFFQNTEHGKILRREIPRDLSTNGVWKGEVSVKDKNGMDRFFDSTALPLIDNLGDQIGTVVLSVDMTQRKIRGEQLRAAMEAAEAANAAKSTFLARMSHELRTPLNAIIGYGEMLQSELLIDSPQSEMVEDIGRIVASGNHLLAIVNGLLDLSKVEAGTTELYIEPVDLVSLVDQAVTTVHSLINKNGNKIELETADAPPAIFSDQLKLTQILINLLSNAAKFTRHGTIRVSVQMETLDSVTIMVTDTGVGIPEDMLPYVFEPFTQADISLVRTHEGAGLGLAICYRFAKLLGGDLAVESKVNEGSRFQLTLPLGFHDYQHLVHASFGQDGLSVNA